jgi:hypothetical protein
MHDPCNGTMTRDSYVIIPTDVEDDEDVIEEDIFGGDDGADFDLVRRHTGGGHRTTTGTLTCPLHRLM